MSVSINKYAEMSEIDISVLEPFLRGIPSETESEILDEILLLKPLYESLGRAETLTIVSKLSHDGKHSDIIPCLKEKEQTLATTENRGLFRWLFGEKGKSSNLPTAAPNTGTKPDNIPPPSHNVDAKHKLAPSDSKESPESTQNEKNNAASTNVVIEEKMCPNTTTHSGNITTPIPHPVYKYTGGEFSQIISREEAELARKYSFSDPVDRVRAEASTQPCIVQGSHTEADETFNKIFEKFLRAATDS